MTSISWIGYELSGEQRVGIDGDGNVYSYGYVLLDGRRPVARRGRVRCWGPCPDGMTPAQYVDRCLCLWEHLDIEDDPRWPGFATPIGERRHREILADPLAPHVRSIRAAEIAAEGS